MLNRFKPTPKPGIQDIWLPPAIRLQAIHERKKKGQTKLVLVFERKKRKFLPGEKMKLVHWEFK